MPRASMTGPTGSRPTARRTSSTSPEGHLDTRPADLARHYRDGCARFSTWCPAGTGVETLVAVEGKRWAIEDAFETAKRELDLEHNETRPGTAGTAMYLCHADLRYADAGAPARESRIAPKNSLALLRMPSSAGRFRRSGVWSCASPAAHPPRPRHRLVALATRPPSRCPTIASKMQNATVVFIRIPATISALQ